MSISISKERKLIDILLGLHRYFGMTPRITKDYNKTKSANLTAVNAS